MKLTNQQIYENAIAIMVAFSEAGKKYIPVKLNFAIQKNLVALATLRDEIEKNRMAILTEYGTLNEEQSQYDIKPEYQEKVSQELQDLFTIEQEVEIKTCSLADIENIDLTMEQMQAIMFMVVED